MAILITSPEIIHLESIQSALKNADIESEIVENNKTFISADGNITEYSLIIADDKLKEAQQILQTLENEFTKQESLPWCPECGCEDVTETVISKKHGSLSLLIASPFLILASLFLPIPIPFGSWVLLVVGVVGVFQYFIPTTSHKYHCNKCNHNFKRL